MKDKIFGVLQRVGRSFMLPIAILPVAGLLLGIGGSFSNTTMLSAYGLMGIMGPGTIPNMIFTVMSQAGDIVFANLPILFAMGVAIGMAKKEKEVAALAAAIAFFIMHAAISAMISIHGGTEALPDGAGASVVGISSLQMGVFGGILVGIGVAYLHNRFYRIELPQVLSFFGGTRFVPIISSLAYVAVGILMYFIWPPIQTAISHVGSFVLRSGYAGTWFYGLMERALIPFGLHHVFYIPFWQTAVGGTMEVGGRMVEGAQNIFFAQLADPNAERFAVSATRFMSGKFPLMIFGLPGAALAMYRTALPEKRKEVSGLLLSAALTSMLTGITEPLEFTFLFAAPLLYVLHCILAGLAYMLMHVFGVGVGMTFSGGLIDLFLFGILQGNKKTGWIWVVIVGIVYFLVYYGLFAFLIRRMNYKTPGREAGAEARLYTRKDVNERKNRRPGGDGNAPGNPGAGGSDDTLGSPGADGDGNAPGNPGPGGSGSAPGNPGSGRRDDTPGNLRTGGGRESGNEAENARSEKLVTGLGGLSNISDVDCCATRLRCTVYDAKKVDEAVLKASGASGVIKKGQGIQIIYGPRVTVIKSDLDEYMESIQQLEDGRQLRGGRKSENVGIPGNGRPGDNQMPEAIRQPDGKVVRTVVVGSPLTGVSDVLSHAPDDAFADGMMGEGAIVTPETDVVYAPADAVVSFVFPTKHAVGLTTKDGFSMLIHVGIDTVKLEGNGFKMMVQEGDTVKKGDAMMKLNLKYIKAHAPSLATPVLFTELAKNQKVRLLHTGRIEAGDDFLAVDIYE